MKNAFLGCENLYGPEGLSSYSRKNYLIIGIGGVGSWIAEYLVRSGVKHITLIDLDEICITNINRQIHALSSNIGKSKVLAMKERLESINPECRIIAHEDFVTQKTIEQIITKEFDYVFDAIDSVKNKCLIIQRCRRLKIPFVSVGAAGSKIDSTKIQVRDLNRAVNDRLLFQVRKTLRKDFNYSKNTKRIYGIPTVYSTEAPLKTSTENDCELKSGTMSNCESGLGSAAHVTSAFAAAAVGHAFKKLIK